MEDQNVGVFINGLEQVGPKTKINLYARTRWCKITKKLFSALNTLNTKYNKNK